MNQEEKDRRLFIKARNLINALLNVHVAPELCHTNNVHKASADIQRNGGTLHYIATVNEEITERLKPKG